MAEAPVIIVGGGFAGTMVAAQLARRGQASVVIDKAGRAGRGTAYSTPEEAHLLNVRAGQMSAWPDRPDDFAQALIADGWDEEAARTGFAPRQRYGAYLRAILDQAVASGLTRVVQDEAVAAAADGPGWRVRLAGGEALEGRALVLATGNQAPEPLRGVPAERLVDDPWSAEGVAAVARAAEAGGPLLVVGTGLSMVDMVLTLLAHGHDGPVTAVSRRGLAPRGHAEAVGPAGEAPQPPGGLLPLMRWLRQRAAEGSWREAVDGLRPLSHALWQGMSAEEQRRFLTHARPWWDVHRHRIAPQVARTLAERIAAGRLEILAGRIRGAEEVGGGVRVALSKRPSTSSGRTEIAREVAAVINCTGPLGRVARTEDPLLRGLLDDRLVEPDWLGLGLRMEADGDRVAGAPNLYAPGALSKGSWWENTAVPDLRGQCERIAEALTK